MIQPGQAYVAGAPVASDYYQFKTVDGSRAGDDTLVRGQTLYYPIELNHRRAFVKVDDVRPAEPGHEYVLYFNNPALLGTYAGMPNVREVCVPGRSVFLWDQFSLPRELRRNGVDVRSRKPLPLTPDGIIAAAFLIGARPQSGSRSPARTTPGWW